MSWWKPAADFADHTLRDLSESLRRKVRFVRLLRNLLAFGIIGTYVSIVFGLVWPQHIQYAVAGAAASLSVALIYWYVVVSMPLQAKSIIRLIEKGYPGNAKELAIRAAARKLHEESIETEELLVDTAINEGRKAYQKYRQRAERLRQELDEEPSVPANLKD